VNAKDATEKTALIIVALSRNSNLLILNYLVEHGADVNVKDWAGRTALDWARSYNKFEIIEYLNPTPIVYGEERSVPEGATEVISYAPIEKGDKMVDFNNEFSFGRYYYQESLKYLRGQNPFTRERIADITYYIVK